jgi:predicted RNase H-like HicB family nuclease
MKKHAVIIEPGPANFSAYVPDLPGCISTGATPAEAERNIREALALHLEGLAEDDLAIPLPTTAVAYVEVDEP